MLCDPRSPYYHRQYANEWMWLCSSKIIFPTINSKGFGRLLTVESACHTNMWTRVQSPESLLRKSQAWCFTLANPNTEEARKWGSRNFKPVILALSHPIPLLPHAHSSGSFGPTLGLVWFRIWLQHLSKCSLTRNDLRQKRDWDDDGFGRGKIKTGWDQAHGEFKCERLSDDDLWKSQRQRMRARGVCGSLVAGTSHLESKQEIYRKANHKKWRGQGRGMVYSKDKGSTKPGHLHGCNPSYSRSRSRRISNSKTV